MAITLADFTKIWASTSPLTPYSFSESNYKEGWNFIGGTPPSRQMWDSIQNQNDEKLKYIVDNYLPLSGGTMTGDIIFDKSFPYIRGNITTGGMGVFAGDNNFDGATLQLFGRNDSDYAGRFYLRASTKSSPSDSNGSETTLTGRSDGTLTWGGKEVERVNASGSNYIRYENGLQICWGGYSGTDSLPLTITYPAAFVASGDFPAIGIQSGIYEATSWGYDSFKLVMATGHTKPSTVYFKYVAVGRWK